MAVTCPYAEPIPGYEAIRGCKLHKVTCIANLNNGPRRETHFLPCGPSQYNGPFQNCPNYKEEA